MKLQLPITTKQQLLTEFRCSQIVLIFNPNLFALIILLNARLSNHLKFLCLGGRNLTLNSNVGSDVLLLLPPPVSLLFISLPLCVLAVFLHQSILASFPLSRPSFSGTHSVQTCLRA